MQSYKPSNEVQLQFEVLTCLTYILRKTASTSTSSTALASLDPGVGYGEGR